MAPAATLTRPDARAAKRPERVAVHAPRDGVSGHERATIVAIAKKIAAVLGARFEGVVEGAPHGAVYLVPSDTIEGIERAKHLGIHDEDDFFGGAVPFPFVACKSVVHPIVDEEASAPIGWSREVARHIADAVHAGYTAFTRDDARRAVELLLPRGAVRFKPVCARGGLGQRVLTSIADLNAAFEAVDDVELSTHGLVLEQNLAEVETLSIGQLRVGDLTVSYCGTQRLTRSNAGRSVYGGSELAFVRGGLEALDALDLDAHAKLAVAQARLFDAAVFACFPGMLASRRNYDVAQGLDAAGRWRSGVLEQSWRIGGASPAEAEALAAFRRDPDRAVVRASCFEVYGAGAEPPAHAAIYYQGIDGQAGPLLKYAIVETNAHTRS